MGFWTGDVEGKAESQDLDHFGLATALVCDPGEDTSSAWATCTASVDGDSTSLQLTRLL